MLQVPAGDGVARLVIRHDSLLFGHDELVRLQASNHAVGGGLHRTIELCVRETQTQHNKLQYTNVQIGDVSAKRVHGQRGGASNHTQNQVVGTAELSGGADGKKQEKHKKGTERGMKGA